MTFHIQHLDIKTDQAHCYTLVTPKQDLTAISTDTGGLVILVFGCVSMRVQATAC
jgi:hypothetical protein